MPTLRRELISALALVFAGALLVGATAVIFLLPIFDTPNQATLTLSLLFVADVAVFTWFGRYLLQRRVLHPLEEMVEGAQAIAQGDAERRLPQSETEELGRLATAVNDMAERLLSHQEQLAANIRSLEETNRLLTEARDELIRAEKLAGVGRLAAGIAHEVGNPLSAILGYLALVGRDAEGQKLELVQAAEREAKRIDRIVRGLLDYARPREMVARELDVNLIVAQTVDLLTTQGRFNELRVDLQVQQALPEVVAEPYQLQQVLVNLLLNAADALAGRSDGVITVRTRSSRHRAPPRLPARRKEDPPHIDYSHRRRFHQTPRIPREASFAAEAPLVEVQVADNGEGIPRELIGNIFDPFVTSKEPGQGTGLGLAVAARLIDAMGGTITAESEPGRGASFTIILPAREQQAAPTGSA